MQYSIIVEYRVGDDGLAYSTPNRVERLTIETAAGELQARLLAIDEIYARGEAATSHVTVRTVTAITEP